MKIINKFLLVFLLLLMLTATAFGDMYIPGGLLVTTILDPTDDHAVPSSYAVSTYLSGGFSQNVLILTDYKLYFRDTGLYVYSSTNGQLDVVADTVLTETSPTITVGASTAYGLTSPAVTITATTSIIHRYDAASYLTQTVTDAGAVKLTVTGDSAGSFEIETDDAAITLDAAAGITLDAGTGTVTTAQVLDVTNTTDASAIGTAAIISDGGLGVAKKSFFGDDMDIADGKKIIFRAATEYIYSSAASTLNIAANTTIAMGGAVTMDSTLGVTGVITATGGLSLPGGKDYTPLQIGVKSSSAGDGFLVAGSGDDSGGVQIYGDDNGAAAAGEVITPLRSRYCLTVGQTGGVTQAGLFAQIVTVGDIHWTTGIVEAAYVFNQAGTIELITSAKYLGINQATTLAGQMTVGSGCVFAGIDINIRGTGAIVNNGTAAGLLIRSSETPVWPVGIEIADSGALIGIDIGNCTTGISMTGAYATAALSINTTLASNDDYALYIVTTCADGTGDTVPVSISSTMSTAGSVGQALKVNQSVATVALGGYVNSIYGILTLGTTGSVSGLGAPICAEIVFPTGTVGGYGTLAGIEIELTTGAATTMLGTVSALWIQTSGSTTGVVDDNGYLFTLVGFGSGSGHMWYDKGSAVTTGDASEWIRVKTPSGDRYLILYDSPS